LRSPPGAARVAEPGETPIWRRLAALALLAALSVAAGCASMGPNLVAPQLSLVGVQVMSTDMFAQRFKVRVLVKNPNEIELPVRGLEYQIILMGDSFADGTSDDAFLLPAQGEAEFDMVITTNFMSAFGRLLSRVGGGKLEDIDYEIVGKLYVDKGVLRKIPFSHNGTVDFTKSLKPLKSEPKSL
jgi:LEA14-like dessication related protein